jgi:hypothetical protein
MRLPLDLFTSKINEANNKRKKDFIKNTLIPLRKGSLLKPRTFEYLTKNLNSFSNNTDANLAIDSKVPNNNQEMVIAGLISKESKNDFIYQYLKTFTPYNDRKKGTLIRYNKIIGYNFNPNQCNSPITNTNNLNNITSSNKTVTPLINNKNEINGICTSPLAGLVNTNTRVSGLNGETNKFIKYSYKLLFYFFKSMYCLISKPVFLFTPDKVIIQLFYYLSIPRSKVFRWYSIFNNQLIRKRWLLLRSKSSFRINNGRKIYNNSRYNQKRIIIPWYLKRDIFKLESKKTKIRNILFNLNKFNLFKVFSLKFKLICEILSKHFKKPVELQLIRLHHPYHDSNILVNLLSINIRNKKKSNMNAIQKVYSRKVIKNLNDPNLKNVNFIPAFISGLSIKVAGRLMREPIIPRITTKYIERGASAPGKVNFLDTATITKKNRKGAYTIKISSGQNFF